MNCPIDGRSGGECGLASLLHFARVATASRVTDMEEVGEPGEMSIVSRDPIRMVQTDRIGIVSPETRNPTRELWDGAHSADSP